VIQQLTQQQQQQQQQQQFNDASDEYRSCGCRTQSGVATTSGIWNSIGGDSLSSENLSHLFFQFLARLMSCVYWFSFFVCLLQGLCLCISLHHIRLDQSSSSFTPPPTPPTPTITFNPLIRHRQEPFE
jgi:hypothetical protein